MARIFKTSFKNRQGKAQEAAKWYAEFRDHNATIRRLPTFTAKPAAVEFLRNVVKLVGYFRASGGQVDPALRPWLQALPAAITVKLVEYGLLDAREVAVSKTLLDHLTDFATTLTAQGVTARQVELVTNRARRIVNGCGFRYFSDIKASAVMAFVGDLRKDQVETDPVTKAELSRKRGISAQTFNFYLAAVKQFARWMVKDRRALENPLSHLDGLNVRTDRRRDRRAMSADELRRLVDVTSRGPDRFGMNGESRAMLYRLAVETGLRSGELRSLTRSSFELDAAQPAVTVAAAYSKRRRTDRVPLRPSLAQLLAAHLANKAPAALAFSMPIGRDDAADMFAADREAAGIAHRDDSGRVVDFHALRHTFITNLAQGGVNPKTAQGLARHSTITLTMDRYTHHYAGDDVAALDVLPDLDAPTADAMKATGTHDVAPLSIVGRDVLASRLAHGGGQSRLQANAGEQIAAAVANAQNAVICGKRGDSSEKMNGEGGIRTLGSASTTPVFETGGKSDAPATVSHSKSPLTQSGNGAADGVFASSLAHQLQNSPDLAMIVDAWSTLPPAVQAGIAAMVRASRS